MWIFNFVILQFRQIGVRNTLCIYISWTKINKMCRFNAEKICVCERIFYAEFHIQVLTTPAIYSHYEMFAKHKKEISFISFRIKIRRAPHISHGNIESDQKRREKIRPFHEQYQTIMDFFLFLYRLAIFSLFRNVWNKNR